jgi:hypothetical protein
MEPEGSSPYTQEPATCPYPEPDQSSLRLGLPSGLLPSGFPAKALYAHLLSPYVPHVLPISVFPTWSPEWYLVRNTEHEARCYVVFSTPLLPHPSWAHFASCTEGQMEWRGH